MQGLVDEINNNNKTSSGAFFETSWRRGFGGGDRTKVTCGGEGCGHPVSYKGNEIETAERRGEKKKITS